MVRLEGLWKRKIAMTKSEIETETFRLVKQCFNQLRQCVPLHIFGKCYKSVKARFQSVKYSRVVLGGRWQLPACVSISFNSYDHKTNTMNKYKVNSDSWKFKSLYTCIALPGWPIKFLLKYELLLWITTSRHPQLVIFRWDLPVVFQ